MLEQIPEWQNQTLGGEEEPKNEQKVIFNKGKEAIERRELDELFACFDRAMTGMADPDAVAWQQLAVNLYAEGVAALGSGEMARLWDERTQDPDTREWLFGHL